MTLSPGQNVQPKRSMRFSPGETASSCRTAVQAGLGRSPAVSSCGTLRSVRRRSGLAFSSSTTSAATVDLIVTNAGQLDDERRGTCSLVAGQHFALVKLDLAREKC